jgi:glycopeptide antibiotics resistance protein
MLNARTGLVVAGLTFATWEAVDVFWISFPAAAALFAALFLASTLWFWRRDSSRAAVALLLLFAFEAAVAPTLKAMTVTKIADLTLALTGIALAATVFVTRRQRRASPPSPREHVELRAR